MEHFLSQTLLGLVYSKHTQPESLLASFYIAPYCLTLKRDRLSHVYSDHKLLEKLSGMEVKSTVSGARESAFKFCSAAYQW